METNGTLASRFRKMRATNATDSSFPSRVPTTTKPDGTGNAAAQTTSSVFQLGQDVGGVTQNGIVASFYAVGSDNVTFSARLYNWKLVPGVPGTSVDLWVPVLLFEVALTASTIVGIAGAAVLDTERFADTVTLTQGNSNVSTEIWSPGGVSANTGIAHVLADVKGPQLLEWTFTTGGSATSCNGLFAVL